MTSSPSGREPWPLAAKILAPLVLALIVAGGIAVLQPTPSDNPPAPVAAKSAPRAHGRRVAATRAVASTHTAPPHATQPHLTLPPATVAPTAAPTTQPPAATVATAARKTCADFSTRISAELWVQYAIAEGLDYSGVTTGPHGEYCPSLPGPDL